MARAAQTAWRWGVFALVLAGCGPGDEDPKDGVDTEVDVETEVPCPGDEEVPYNGVDDDCDPATADDDLDGDGALAAVDCDDDDADRSPELADAGWDGVDQNCDGVDLEARVSSPSLLVDLGLPGDLLYPSVAVDGGHALVVGRVAAPAEGAGLVGAVVDLATGEVSPFTVAAPDAGTVTRDVVAWARPGGFGVLVAHEDWGMGGRCHLYGTPVGTDGTVGTVRRLTDTASSQSFCDVGHSAVAMSGGDHLFHLQPQGFVAGEGNTGNAHVVRRVVDLDDGTTLDVEGYGVNQGGAMAIDAVIPFGPGALFAYQFSGGATTKVAVFDEQGLADDASNARIYGGLAAVLSAPHVPVSLVSDGVVDPSDGTETAALLRVVPDPSDSTPTLEWAQVDITPGDPNVATVSTGGVDTPALLGPVADLRGAVVAAEPGGGYRAVWMAGGALWSTQTTTAAARVGDERLAGEDAALLGAAQRDGALVLLVSWVEAGAEDGGSLHLVTSMFGQ